MVGKNQIFPRNAVDADQIAPLVHDERKRLRRIVGRADKRRVGDLDIALDTRERDGRKVRAAPESLRPNAHHAHRNRHGGEIRVLAIGKGVFANLLQAGRKRHGLNVIIIIERIRPNCFRPISHDNTTALRARARHERLAVLRV